MSISILVDMNLSPEWVSTFVQAGRHAVHWSQVGSVDAEDHVLMDWAKENRHVVFTHDLDFGMLLALTHASGPSVIQLRSQQVLPEHASTIVLAAVAQFETELTQGALIVIDESGFRARILPF